MAGNPLVGSPPGRRAFFTERTPCSALYASILSLSQRRISSAWATLFSIDGFDIQELLRQIKPLVLVSIKLNCYANRQITLAYGGKLIAGDGSRGSVLCHRRTFPHDGPNSTGRIRPARGGCALDKKARHPKQGGNTAHEGSKPIGSLTNNLMCPAKPKQSKR